MYVNAGTGPDTIVAPVEENLHTRLAMRFMPCRYDGTVRRRLQQQQQQQQQQQLLEFTRLSSLPVDGLSSTTTCSEQEQRPGQDCYVVDAGFTPTYITLDTTEGAVNELGMFLTDTMDGGALDDSAQNLTGLVFRGFTQVPSDTEEAPDDRGDSVAGVGGQEGSIDNSRSALIGGASAITLAILGALVVVLFVVRRQRREELYSKHVEDGSVFSIGAGGTLSSGPKNNAGSNSPGGSSGDHMRAIVLSDEEMLMSADEADEMGFEALPGEWNHDPDTCQSPTCEICLSDKMKQPTFVRADTEAQIEHDLGPQRTVSPDRLYYSPDTIDL